jgi:hypothetical protein
MPTFEIPDGPTTIEAPRSAKSPQPAESSAVYSVTNTSSDSVVGRLGVKVVGGSKEAWFTIDGDRERTFDSGETQTVTVRVSFPSDVLAGEYPFRLRAVAVNDPDNDHAEGPVTTAKLGAGGAPVGKKSLLWLWILLGIVAVLSIALGLYFLLSSGKPEPVEKVPNAPTPTVPAAPAPVPAPSGPPVGRVEIANLNSGLCLSPAGGGRNPNDQIVQYLCDDHPSRYWSFERVDGNTVKIVDQDNKLCLTIAGGSRDPNIAAVQYYCDAHPSRQWDYEIVDGTKFRLRNLNSGLCLTIAGGSTDRNVVAVQYPCDGHPSRDWRISR